ncbi:MAG: lipopolysaccharide biosynthesis protein [Parvularculaceae bacterium]
MPEKSITGKLLTGAAWIGLSRIAVNLIGIISTIVLARLLAPEDFGLVALALAFMAVINAFTALPIGMAVIQTKDATHAHYDTAWTLNILRAAIVNGAAVALVWPFASFYGDARLVPLLIVIALGSFISAAGNPQMIRLQKDLVFWQIFVVEFSRRATAFAVAVAIAYYFRSYWALVLGTIAAHVVGLAIGYAIAPYLPRFTLAKAREMLSFSIWMSLSQIINTLSWRLDHFLIGGVLGQTQLGIYTVGNDLAGVATRDGLAVVQSTLFPGFAKVNGGGEIIEALRRSQSFISMFALPIGVGTALVADPLIPIAVGEKWREAIPIVQVCACIFAFQSLTHAANPLILAQGRPRLLFFRDALLAAYRTPLIIAGVLLAGIPGILMARAISGPSLVFINLALLRRITGAGYWAPLACSKRSIISVVVMGASVLLLRPLLFSGESQNAQFMGLAASIALGAIVYGAAHAGLWIAGGRPKGPEALVLQSALAGRAKFYELIKKKFRAIT